MVDLYLLEVYVSDCVFVLEEVLDAEFVGLVINAVLGGAYAGELIQFLLGQET